MSTTAALTQIAPFSVLFRDLDLLKEGSSLNICHERMAIHFTAYKTDQPTHAEGGGRTHRGTFHFMEVLEELPILATTGLDGSLTILPNGAGKHKSRGEPTRLTVVLSGREGSVLSGEMGYCPWGKEESLPSAPEDSLQQDPCHYIGSGRLCRCTRALVPVDLFDGGTMTFPLPKMPGGGAASDDTKVSEQPEAQ